MRLDKFLALQGLGTRSEVRALVRAGRVCMNGETARDAGTLIDPAHAAVTCDGTPLVYEASAHLMLHKPAGVLTAARDPHRETVMDLLPARYAAMGCMPVGRLDMDTEGLLILTTDGALAHRLLSPKRHVDKVYLAVVDVPLDEADVTAFAGGVALSDFTALPAKLAILPDGLSAHVTVREGKYHQVRRMFAARGKTVVRLKRLSFGGVPLDETLAPGAWRSLTDAELQTLIRASEGMIDG